MSSQKLRARSKQLLRTGLETALSAAELVVGTGSAVSAHQSCVARLKRRGLLPLAAEGIGMSCVAIGTALAVGAQMFAPAKWATPYDWSLQLSSPDEWLQAAALGHATWGRWAAWPIRRTTDVVVGVTRGLVGGMRAVFADPEITRDAAGLPERYGDAETSSLSSPPAGPQLARPPLRYAYAETSSSNSPPLGPQPARPPAQSTPPAPNDGEAFPCLGTVPAEEMFELELDPSR